MNKLTILAICGLVACVSATNTIEITKDSVEQAMRDMELNHLALEKAINDPREEFVSQDVSFRSHKLMSTATSVQWSDDPTCPNKADSIEGIANPDPPVVGKNVNL